MEYLGFVPKLENVAEVVKTFVRFLSFFAATKVLTTSATTLGT